MKKLLLALSFASLAAAAAAKDLVNVDRRGLALEGHDPVAFFVDGRPLLGDPAFTASHRGATYRFASREHQALFTADPDRYAPAFGGFCAYALSRGSTAPVEIETWQIFDGRLLLNYNLQVKAKFDVDRAALLARADANWPGLVEAEGR